MEILHNLSKDKLVIVVTHNYEQAEPFVTRKILILNMTLSLHSRSTKINSMLQSQNGAKSMII